MKRIKDDDGIVHFERGDLTTLCGEKKRDLLGDEMPMESSNECVTCTECTRLYCEIRNTPLNAIADEAYDSYWASLADVKFGNEES